MRMQRLVQMIRKQARVHQDTSCGIEMESAFCVPQTDFWNNLPGRVDPRHVRRMRQPVLRQRQHRHVRPDFKKTRQPHLVTSVRTINCGPEQRSLQTHATTSGQPAQQTLQHVSPPRELRVVQGIINCIIMTGPV